MKKRIALFITTVFAVLLLPATSLASSRFTDVSGVIDFDGAHVGKGTKVLVTCNGHALKDKTNKKGAYSVQFKKKQCSKKDTITVTATVNGITGTSTGKADKEKCRLNVAIINVSIVPEYGLIGLTGATFIGGGAFLVIRRRQLSGHET